MLFAADSAVNVLLSYLRTAKSLLRWGLVTDQKQHDTSINSRLLQTPFSSCLIVRSAQLSALDLVILGEPIEFASWTKTGNNLFLHQRQRYWVRKEKMLGVCSIWYTVIFARKLMSLLILNLVLGWMCFLYSFGWEEAISVNYVWLFSQVWPHF